MNNQTPLEALQGLRFLQGISREHLEEIARIAQLRDHPASEVVFREGDIAKQVYLVVSGLVSLEICAPSVGCKRILTAGPGEILAWSALLDDSRLTATARTIEVTRLVELDAAQLLSMCERNLEFGYEFMRRTLLGLAKRLSATRMQLLDVFGPQMPAAAEAAEGDDES